MVPFLIIFLGEFCVTIYNNNIKLIYYDHTKFKIFLNEQVIKTQRELISIINNTVRGDCKLKCVK